MLRTTQSTRNLSSLIAEDAEIGSINSGSDNKTVKKLLLMSKNLNRTTSYLTPNTKRAFI